MNYVNEQHSCSFVRFKLQIAILSIMIHLYYANKAQMTEF